MSFNAIDGFGILFVLLLLVVVGFFRDPWSKLLLVLAVFLGTFFFLAFSFIFNELWGSVFNNVRFGRDRGWGFLRRWFDGGLVNNVVGNVVIRDVARRFGGRLCLLLLRL